MKFVLYIIAVLLAILSGEARAQQKLFSLYLIGDAGQQTLETNGVPELLKANVDSVSSAFAFLGDNIYPKGMPLRGERGRERSEAIIRDQIGLVNGFHSPVYFIPGNHDWNRGRRGGRQRLAEQQKFIDSSGYKNVYFLPQQGCPGPVELALHDSITMVIIDSQWFLHPWEKPEGDDSPCSAKSMEDAALLLDDIFERNKNKRVVVLAHHPIYTYGEHGGVFTWKDHLFPLRELNPKLYVPLPVIGSFYPLYRKYFGDIQDIVHPVNKRFRGMMETIAKRHPGTIYASGHEHALEYVVKDNVHYVVSGSGSKNTVVKKKGYAQYASLSSGFARIDFYSGGDARITYFEADKKSEGFTTLLKPFPVQPHHSSSPEGVRASSVEVHASDQYRAGPVKRWLLGANYRAEWKQDLDIPEFDIGSGKGGLKIIQKGGGQQTLSLRLADSTGHQFTLRSIEKYPGKAVPEMLRKTFAEDLVQDQISASHPYAALVVPYLAEAAGIYHTNPQAVFIPDDPRLGTYQKEFANTPALFEERPEGEAKDKPYFGNARKIVGTEKVLEKLMEDNDNRVDQEFVLRSRLFDIVIGDWDRHDDQWRWAVFKDKRGEYYRPIPRDRDQAFFVGDGVLSAFWSRKWAMPKFEGFHDRVRWTPGFMYNGRYFDRTFLNALTSESWLMQATSLKQSLTDSAIASSIEKFPKPIYELHGDEIIRKLRSRRDHLTDYALEHYRFLSREVDVVGSGKNEHFEITSDGSGKVTVDVSKISKKGKVTDKLFSRTFLPSETREVRLYGLGGDDVFNLRGSSKSRIHVRVIGGEGRDSVQNHSPLRTIVYDNPDGIVMNHHRITDKTSVDPDVNTYDRKAFRYPRLAPLLYGNFNYDDGLFLGGGFYYINHGFRKDQFKSRHLFLATFAPLTRSYNFKYDGEFAEVIGKWNLELNFDIKAPNYVNNFFGWGNETKFDRHIDEQPGLQLHRAVDYYRVRLHQVEVRMNFAHALGAKALFKVGPVYQRTEITQLSNHQRFINEYAATLADPLFENEKTFAGLNTQWKVDTRNDKLFTTNGILLTESSLFMKGIEHDAHNFTSHQASLSLYHAFRLPVKVAFAGRAGGGTNTGTYELYQAQILDGKTELRGFRKTRFYGDSRVYNNNEVRIKLASFRSYLFPATLGMNAFYDVGRVWYKDVNGVDPSAPGGKSSLWHTGIGGGLWFTPFNLTVLSAELAHSREGNMFYVRLGFLF